MKKFLTILLAFVALRGASQTHVAFDLNAPFFNAVPASNRWVTIQAMTPFIGNLNNYTSSASGTFTISNMFAADYRGSIQAYGNANRIQFDFTVVNTNLGVVAAHSITSIPGISIYPPTGRSAWSVAAETAWRNGFSNFVVGASVSEAQVVAIGDTNYVKNTNGVGYGETLLLGTRIGTGSIITNGTITGTVENTAQNNFTGASNFFSGQQRFDVPSGNFIMNIGDSNLVVSKLGTGIILWSAGVAVAGIGPNVFLVSTNLQVGGVIHGEGTGVSNVISSVTVGTVADSPSSVNYVAFFDNPTGNQQPKTSTGITFNSTTESLATGGGFVGNLTGNATTASTAGSAGTAALIDNAPWTTVKYPDGGDGVEYAFRSGDGSTDFILSTNGGVRVKGPLTWDGVATGNGAGITNLSGSVSISNFIQEVTFTSNTFNVYTSYFNTTITTNNAFFNGKVNFTSNVFIQQLSFAATTSSPPVLTLNCTDQGMRTNNNVNFSGFNIPPEYGVTNSAWATVLVTNDSANPFIQLFFPGCIGDTNCFVTNQASFTVKKFPGMGTNVAFNSLK